jgi:Leucine-rich repeat (LRR) protein
LLGSANQSLQHLNLTKLDKLDLSGNSFDHEIASCWFWKVTSLKYLNLRYHRLFGQFHDALENMTSLQVLDLSFNFNQKRLVMEGNFNNLFSLKILDLTDNEMNRAITVLMDRLLPQRAWVILEELHLGLIISLEPCQI